MPPIRLYFRHLIHTDQLEVFEFEMKTNPDKQKKTINRLRNKSSKT
ncbi:MAG: hypothetical protein ACQEP1_05515 [Nanobdellota archaeon]